MPIACPDCAGAGAIWVSTEHDVPAAVADSREERCVRCAGSGEVASCARCRAEAALGECMSCGRQVGWECSAPDVAGELRCDPSCELEAA